MTAPDIYADDDYEHVEARVGDTISYADNGEEKIGTIKGIDYTNDTITVSIGPVRNGVVQTKVIPQDDSITLLLPEKEHKKRMKAEQTEELLADLSKLKVGDEVQYKFSAARFIKDNTLLLHGKVTDITHDHSVITIEPIMEEIHHVSISDIISIRGMHMQKEQSNVNHNE